MKNILLPTLWAGALAIAAAACTEGPRGRGGYDEVPEAWTPGPKNIPDSAWVPVAEARRMVANYAPRAGYVERDGQQLPNTRVAWVPLDYLESMVDRLHDEGGDGIHIYLAAYDSVYTAETQHVPPPEWWGYNTVLFTSTRDSVADGQHYHRDYFTFEQYDYYGWERYRGAEGFIVTMEPLNRVGICPPPDKCKDKGALLLEDRE